MFSATCIPPGWLVASGKRRLYKYDIEKLLPLLHITTKLIPLYKSSRHCFLSVRSTLLALWPFHDHLQDNISCTAAFLDHLLAWPVIHTLSTKWSSIAEHHWGVIIEVACVFELAVMPHNSVTNDIHAGLKHSQGRNDTLSSRLSRGLIGLGLVVCVIFNLRHGCDITLIRNMHLLNTQIW
jgi:hypothetical protein